MSCNCKGTNTINTSEYEVKQITRNISTCEELKKKNVYPVSITQAIFDKCTGERLDEVLSKVNHLSLAYIMNEEETLLQVDPRNRKVGLLVTFVSPSGKITTLRYEGNSTRDDQWKLRSNWVELSKQDNSTTDPITPIKPDSKSIDIFNDKFKVFFELQNNTVNGDELTLGFADFTHEQTETEIDLNLNPIEASVATLVEKLNSFQIWINRKDIPNENEYNKINFYVSRILLKSSDKNILLTNGNFHGDINMESFNPVVLQYGNYSVLVPAFSCILPQFIKEQNQYSFTFIIVVENITYVE